MYIKAIYTVIFINLLSLFAVSADQQPKKELIYLGGWTKFPEEDTFDDSVVPAGKFFADSEYHKDIYFGGNSIRLNNLTEKSFKDTVHFFSEENYNRFEKQLLDPENPYYGKYTKGDQVLIIMDNHGGPPKKNWKIEESDGIAHIVDEETHGGPYGINSPNTLDGPFSMDQTIKVIKELKTRGVKVAVIDSSCYSGTSQALAKYGACVISTTGPNSLSYPEFKRVLFSKFEKGKSLEQVYLEARADSKSPNIPEISSETGEKLSVNLTNMWISPRLDTKEDLTDKLIKFTYPSNVERCDLLPKSSQQQITEALKTFLNVDPENSPKVRELAQAIDQYDQTVLETTKQMQTDLGPNAYNQEHFEIVVYNNPLKPERGVIQNTPVSWDYLTNLDRPEMQRAIQNMQESLQKLQRSIKLLTNQNEIDSTQYQINSSKAWLDYYEKVTAKKRELEENTDENSPGYENAKRFRQFAKTKAKYEELINSKIYAKTKELIQKERALYDQLYKEMMKNDPHSNACREFKL